MVPVKVECECGQRYAFDVEPVGNRMPYVVACPTCGRDGTTAANQVIAQAMAPQAAVPVAAPAVRVRMAATNAAPAAAPVSLAVHTPPVTPVFEKSEADRKRVQDQARAKIFWGDAPNDVVKYLMMEGYSYHDASKHVAGLSKERGAATRANGIRKVVMGVPMMFVPLVAWVLFARAGFIPVKLFALAVMVGVYGGWLTLNGTLMLIAPKIESGDVADQ